MSIRITQKCDSCGKVRRLHKVRPNKYVCGDCIDGLLTPKEAEKTDD